MSTHPFILAGVLLATVLHGAEPQNPSPMVEHTREHPRLTEEHPEGSREKLKVGMLFVPAALSSRADVPLLVFLHGGTWLPEVVAARRGMAAIVIQKSSPYADSFTTPKAFVDMLKEASTVAKQRWGTVTLAGWSAGCGGIRTILQSPDAVAAVQSILLIDGVHTSYTHGKPGPLESDIDTAKLAPIVDFARLAVDRKKRLLITHSEIFPGTFASTTETADQMLRELKIGRRAILEWGPMKTQMVSSASSGAFRLVGFAGNSAPDHVDQLHALADLLGWLDEMKLSAP